MRDLAYEQRELADAARNEREVERAPLAERKEAQEAFFQTIKHNPAIVAERVTWLLDGQYGMGAMLQAHSVTKRSNRPAAYSQMIAVLDHNCPRAMAVAAWKKLTAKEQTKLQQLLETAIEEFDASQREEHSASMPTEVVEKIKLPKVSFNPYARVFLPATPPSRKARAANKRR